MFNWRYRCFNAHQQKLEELTKVGDMKKVAKTVEAELEKKKIEKLANKEFILQGKQYNKHCVSL